MAHPVVFNNTWRTCYSLPTGVPGLWPGWDMFVLMIMIKSSYKKKSLSNASPPKVNLRPFRKVAIMFEPIKLCNTVNVLSGGTIASRLGLVEP